MIYNVEWTDAALEGLRALWEPADPTTRSAIRRAIARIQDRLAIAPYTEGDSRPPGDHHLLFELPLCVTYRMERFGGAAVVIHIRLIRKRRP